MFKKIHFYTFKLFIFYFCIITIILFFLFIIEFFWSKLNEIIGTGINTLIIIKLLFYFGISLIPLITPISILLTSIMIYGIFSESYELIAVKSLGISFWRIINPIFIIIIIISIIIYLFSDYIIPFSQKKIKNIAYNISKMKYGINIPTGIFIDYIPNIIIKIDKKIEKNYYKNIFIKIKDNYLNNIRIIFAKKGLLIPYKKNDFFYLKLFNGTIYQEKYKNYKEKKDSYQIIKFDNFIQILKIPLLIDQKDNLISTLNTKELIDKINQIELNKKKYYINNYYSLLEKKKLYKNKYIINNFLIKKNNLMKLAKIELKKYFNIFFIEKNKIKKEEKYLLKIKLELQRKFSFSVTCIVMFFIGAPIGAIIKKGNIGFPVIITIIIFVIYYTFLTISTYLAENGIINIIIGAWIANIIMLPLGLYLTYVINNDNKIL